MAIFEDWPYHDDVTVVRPMKKNLPVYLRFGHFDKSERSMNHTTGEYEKGLSVYPAEIVDGVAAVYGEWIDHVLDGWHVFSDRVQYLVTGRLVDSQTGSDGEPVLRLSSIVIRGIKSPSLTTGIKINANPS